MSYGTLRSIQSLGIVYSCVTRGTTILAFHACCQGNFSEVVPKVLAMIPSSKDDRMTYTSGDYFFHYVCEEGVIVLCITDDDFERSRAFLFLEEVKASFLDNFSDNLTRYSPYSLNSTFGEFLSQKMDSYSEDSYMSVNTDDVRRVKLETINVRDLDVYNESGELEQLELVQSDDNFSIRSIEGQIEERRVKCYRFCQKHVRIIFIIVLMVIIILIILLAVMTIAIVDEDAKHEVQG